MKHESLELQIPPQFRVKNSMMFAFFDEILGQSIDPVLVKQQPEEVYPINSDPALQREMNGWLDERGL